MEDQRCFGDASHWVGELSGACPQGNVSVVCTALVKLMESDINVAHQTELTR